MYVCIYITAPSPPLTGPLASILGLDTLHEVGRHLAGGVNVADDAGDVTGRTADSVLRVPELLRVGGWGGLLYRYTCTFYCIYSTFQYIYGTFKCI